MACRLRSYEVVPPGGYPYENTQGIYRKFPSEPLIEAQARALSAFRKGNGLQRSSVTECLQDIDEYTCRRLGCPHQLCVSTDAANPQIALSSSSPVLGGGRGCCGAAV